MRAGFVITANALIEGDVVWLTPDSALTRDLLQAQVFTERDAAESVLAQVSARADELVGPYLAEVRLAGQGPAPTHFREMFRTRGPSNYRHGKQAETGTTV